MTMGSGRSLLNGFRICPILLWFAFWIFCLALQPVKKLHQKNKLIMIQILNHLDNQFFYAFHGIPFR